MFTRHSKSKPVPELQVCRICLSMDRKLHDINKHNLHEYFEQIIGINMSAEDRLPQKVCWECGHRLSTWSRFRSKALRSHQLMLDMVHGGRYLTKETIESIDRESHNLISNLTHTHYDANYNDLHLHDTSENNEIIPIQEVNINEIKEEYDSDFNIEAASTCSSDIVLSKHKKEKKLKKKINKEVKVDRRRKPANEVLNESIFEITDLSYKDQVTEIEKRQDSANYRNSEFKCKECFKGFLDEEAYKGHMIRHTDQSGTYECKICKIRFKKQHALRNHSTSHMQKFTCKRCPYVTTRRHAAKLHEEFHNGTRYQCPHCQEDFVKISTYMSHIRIKHPSDFVCELCGYSFVSAKGLGLHKKLKHRFDEQPVPEDGPSCIECEVRFVTKEALDRHLKLSARHNDDKDSTRKRSRRPRDMLDKNDKSQKDTEHKKRRNNCKPEGPIPCEQCDMQLPDSLSYYRHFRRTHPDKNRTHYPSMKTKSMCEVCGKMFQSLALLQDHSWTHTGHKQFSCSTCGKLFQRKYRLIAHSRVHRPTPGGTATHACRLCAKRFTTASNMHRHMFSHTGLKPFKCEMCGKCFKHASEKRVHITYVHLKKPWPKRTRGKRRDARQVQIPAQPPNTIGTELDIVQPLWPACNDPKVRDILMDDKAMYYRS